MTNHTGSTFNYVKEVAKWVAAGEASLSSSVPICHVAGRERHRPSCRSPRAVACMNSDVIRLRPTPVHVCLRKGSSAPVMLTAGLRLQTAGAGGHAATRRQTSVICEATMHGRVGIGRSYAENWQIWLHLHQEQLQREGPSAARLPARLSLSCPPPRVLRLAFLCVGAHYPEQRIQALPSRTLMAAPFPLPRPQHGVWSWRTGPRRPAYATWEPPHAHARSHEQRADGRAMHMPASYTRQA
ncbi:hypothetical protein FH972_021535 [Carpinus fangiana]|uniref:Uncharacterized protein n=1 Tax=Carpinus fangiana TaxID=176857 RepID=A0A5N6KPY8_9ROSI|nr:hypothetical protein FH972_021535 [Carpinus fangiana]